MDVGDEGSDIARVLRFHTSTVAILERADHALDPRRPLVPVTLIDAVILPDVG